MKRFLAIMLIAILLMPAMGAMAEDDWWNILLLGGDSRQLDTYDRTDTMIILSLNEKNSQIKLTSVMRDTWVAVQGKNCKINAANVYGGPEQAVATVNEYFGTDIEDYVLVNMTSLLEIIDVIGGIDLEVNESERKYINQYALDYLHNVNSNYAGATSLHETGVVHLNGLLATAYARNRYTDSDYGRVERQQKVLLAAAKKLQQMDLNISLLMELVNTVLDDISTNLSLMDIVTIANVGMSAELDQIQQYRVPVDGHFTTATKKGIWRIQADFAANTRLLQEFIYGE